MTNDGTLVLDAPGSGSTSGGNTYLTNGTVDNNGTFISQVEDPKWENILQASVVNGSSGKIDVNSGTLASSGGTTSNSGLVTVAPSALWSLDEGATLVNAAGGTIVPEIASATSYGSFQLTSPCCNGPGVITAGGALTPQLVGGFTPGAKEEFPIVALQGGTFTGKFGSVGPGFAADYTKEAASPAFVGVVYGRSAAVPGLSVGKVSAGGTKLSLSLRCATGAACSGVRIAGTVTEHLKRGKVKAVTASAQAKAKKTTKVVVVASATTALAQSAKKTISIRLNATGRKLLARFHKLTVLTTVRIGAKTVRTVKVVFHASKERYPDHEPAPLSRRGLVLWLCSVGTPALEQSVPCGRLQIGPRHEFPRAASAIPTIMTALKISRLRRGAQVLRERAEPERTGPTVPDSRRGTSRRAPRPAAPVVADLAYHRHDPLEQQPGSCAGQHPAHQEQRQASGTAARPKARASTMPTTISAIPAWYRSRAKESARVSVWLTTAAAKTAKAVAPASAAEP